MIESDSLLRDCQLISNKNLCIDTFDNVDKIDLNAYLSDYYTPQQYSLNINYNASNYKQLTELGEALQLLTECEKIEFDVESLELKVIESGRVDFVLYWYELSGGGSGDDGKFEYSPVTNANLNSTDTFWSQIVAFSLYDKRKEIILNQHSNVNLSFLFKNQMFFIRNLTPK